MEEKVEQKNTYIVNKKSKNNTNVVAIILALIGGIIGGALVSILTNNSGSIKDTVQAITNKYEITKTDSPVVAISAKVSPSVVGIKVTYSYEVFRGFSTESEGEGSGIIYSEDGYIVTNYHVIEAAIDSEKAKVEVALEGSEEWIEAKIIGHDEITDLAVIKIDKTGLQAAEFGKSADLKVGDIAVAIGNPLGQEFAGTVTSGIVSALNRTITTDGRTYELIQTDAAINTGNSGGALANSKGEVIGINTVKIVATGVEGIGFAIPSDEAVPIIKELIENKKISRPSIGIGGINVTESIAKAYNMQVGVYVSEVMKDSPAEAAGFKAGDIIIKAEDKEIKTMDELNNIKYKYKVGDKFKVTVLRDSKEVELTVTLGEE